MKTDSNLETLESRRFCTWAHLFCFVDWWGSSQEQVPVGAPEEAQLVGGQGTDAGGQTKSHLSRSCSLVRFPTRRQEGWDVADPRQAKCLI